MGRFDTDPEALEWARNHVQSKIDRLEGWAAKDLEAGNVEHAEQWRRMARHMRRELIGGSGCVIARFDERKGIAPKLALCDLTLEFVDAEAAEAAVAAMSESLRARVRPMPAANHLMIVDVTGLELGEMTVMGRAPKGLRRSYARDTLAPAPCDGERQ